MNTYVHKDIGNVEKISRTSCGLFSRAWPYKNTSLCKYEPPDFAQISRLKSPENADSARFSAIFAQANLLHKINCTQKRPMTAITAIGRKILGTEENSALAELGRATSSLQAVLNISMVRFSLILRAFSHFLLSVVLFLNHGNR